MKLNNYLSNNNCIGKDVHASINLDRNWIKYSSGHTGDPNYYRDFLHSDGHMIYCDGELCTILSFDGESETVTLNVFDTQELFIIPYEQYVADFGLEWK